MQQNEAEVNVRLKVRPLGSNWRLVKRVQQDDNQDTENEPALDGTVWKTNKYRTEPVDLPSPKIDKQPVKVKNPGIIRKCECTKCNLAEDEETSLEMQPMKITQIPCELISGQARRRKPKQRKCPSPSPPPPPPPQVLRSHTTAPSVTQTTYEEPLQLKPAILQSDTVLIGPPPPAPPPTIVDTPSVEMAVLSSSTVIKVKSNSCVCSSNKSEPRRESHKTSSTNTDSTRTAISPALVEELLENRDIEIENRIDAIVAQTSYCESTPFSMRKIFYDSESNMWLLIALIVLTILAYRSSMDTHMCYYD